MMTRFTLRLIAASVAMAATVGAQSNASRDEDFARRQYESGMSFMQNKRYAEALKDFQAIVDSFPRTSVADAALLQIAQYQLDFGRNVPAAQAANEKLLKEYPDGAAAAMGYVLAGRLAITKGRAQSDVEAALASFERVPRLYPGSEAVAAAGYYAGNTLQLVRRTSEALDRYRRVAMEFPRSVWTARAAIASAVSLVQLDRGASALEGLQRARLQFPGSPEATQALNYNTMIYRLFVRPPAQPAFAFSGKYVGSEAQKFKDVVQITIDDSGRLLMGHKQGISQFDAKATLVKTTPVENPSAFFIDERGRLNMVRNEVVITENAEATAVALPNPGGKPKNIDEIPSVVLLSNGDRLIADHKGKAVLRFVDGKFTKNFASAIAIERLAVNLMDDVAMLDKDSKGVVIADRDGKTLSKIPAKGTGYELDNPVDIAFDGFGDLYVLDRGKPFIHVFSPRYKLITSFTVPEKEPGAFSKPQAFGIDAAGRLYVYDDRAQRIQVYQ